MFILDFSIFKSPVEALGRVSGEMDGLKGLEVGDELILFHEPFLDFSGRLTVVSKTHANDERDEIFGLESVVCKSEKDANALVEKLEGKLGLFFDPY